MIIEDPEFVFYHNPTKGIIADHFGGNQRLERAVRDCFRKLTPAEIERLQIGICVYVDREIYEDDRIEDSKGLQLGIKGVLQGMLKVEIVNAGGLGFTYRTVGNCEGMIRLDLATAVYDSPEKEKISELVIMHIKNTRNAI